jgi:hypothetical protein
LFISGKEKNITAETLETVKDRGFFRNEEKEREKIIRMRQCDAEGGIARVIRWGMKRKK